MHDIDTSMLTILANITKIVMSHGRINYLNNINTSITTKVCCCQLQRLQTSKYSRDRTQDANLWTPARYIFPPSILGGVGRGRKQPGQLESIARGIGISSVLRSAFVAVQTRAQERRRHKCSSSCW